MKSLLIALCVFFPIMSVQAVSLHVRFLGKTNIPGMEIEGELKTPLKLEKSQGIIPIKSLKTGMESRDDHMYEEIFKNKDIHFSLTNMEECLSKETCQAEIKIKMADVEKALKVKVEKKGTVRNAKFPIKLTDFKIAPPSKFGVSVEEVVEVSVEVRDQ